MNCADFLRMVLPNTGEYCLCTIMGKRCINTPVTSIQTLVDMGVSQAPHTNVYFALSSYQRDNGKFRRLSALALRQKALWLDLDCDPGKSYANQSEAGQALARFIKDTGLPMPATVNSGYGYHLYWPFDTEIDTANWKNIARILADVCNKYGLKVDHHRTRDAASVLRMPGTVNHKYGRQASVSIVYCPSKPYSLTDLLKKLMELNGVSTEPTPVPPVPEGLSFGNSFEPHYENLPLNWHDMVAECKQIQNMGLGKYPTWMLATRTLLHTVNGEYAIHELSAFDKERYTHEDTQHLIDGLRQSGDIGPGRCDTFADHNSALCAHCPHRGHITSPLQLCKPDKPKPITMPAVDITRADLSKGEIALGDATRSIEVEPYCDKHFQVIPNKGIYVLIPDEKDPSRVTPMRIAPFELYIHTLCVDNTQGNVPKRTYIVRKVVRDCAPVDIPFALEDALGPTKIELWTGQCGLYPMPQHKKDFFTFMNTYIASIQNKLPEVYVRDHFGWHTCVDKQTGKTYEGFIVGDTMYSSKGKSQVRLDERAASIATKLGTRGSLEAWKDVPRLYRILGQKFAQLLMCTAFGAPLMKFGIGTATNIAYNFWDINGGKGKSSMLKALASVWGDPHQMLMGRTDTHAARFQQYSVYRNLPILIDELTGIDDAETASLLYDIVNGREKSRSTSSGTGLAKSGQWDTITVFTANQSMYESLRDYRSQTTATCMRLIECVCDFKDYTNTEMAPVINHAMSAAQENYGVAGARFIEFVMENPTLTTEATRYAEKFAIRHAKSADERFWLYGIAIPLIAGRFACALGLLDYDMNALESYCIDELLPELRSKVKADKPSGKSLIVDFLNDNLDATLIVQAHTRAQLDEQIKRNGVRETTWDPNMVDRFVVHLPTRMLIIRRELDTGDTYVSTRALREWCKRKGISLDALLTDLRLTAVLESKTATRSILGLDVNTLTQGRQSVLKLSIQSEVYNNAK